VTTKLYTINPKDRSVVELYGVLDPNTRDWTDGLLSNIFRDINKPTDKNERKYASINRYIFTWRQHSLLCRTVS